MSSPSPKARKTENQLSIEWWPLERPKPYPANARKLSARAIETLAKSIKEFGWRQPIVVDVKDVIVAGHTRLLAAQHLQLTQVPVHVARELTAAQIRAYRIMDNRSADETEWDMPTLEAELAELAELEVDLSTTGFDEKELRDLMTAEVDEEDTPAAPTNPVSRIADLWILGNHRVICGDSTDQAAIARLCEAQCACLWTDPPYGVKYVGKTPAALQICGDEPGGIAALVLDALKGAEKHLIATAPFYIAHPAGGEMSLVFATAVRLAGWRVHQNLVWLKDSMVLGHSDYHYRHEPIMYGYTPGSGRPGRGRHKGSRWFGSHSETSVLEFPRPKASLQHPTMKPPALIERCLANSTEPGDAVLDLFGGSGSTLIACEKTARRARLIELSPGYVDVIVQRWQAFTGQTATLEGDGRTFEKVKASRLKRAK